MKLTFKILTGIFGLFWLIFGLNYFFHFFPLPQQSQAGSDFMTALKNSGYVLPLVYGTQIVAGVMFLARRFVGLALLLLGPVILNILFYDLFLNPSGVITGVVITVLYGFLLFDQRQKLIPILQS